MYLSHAVRTIRDDPMADESVALVVTLADDPARDESADSTDRETLEATVAALGGEVVADLQFSAVHVRLPEPAVADLCALDGIERIETAETLRLVGEETAESVEDADGSAGDDASRRPGHDREP
jgi:hypothetical protein